MNKALPHDRIPSPAFVIDMEKLESNLRVLKDVQERAGCQILLALKGFATWSTFPLVKKYLPGVAASSLAEARLGKEKFGGVVHTYSPAYSPDEFDETLSYSDHLVFNSMSQVARFSDAIKKNPNKHFGIRLNPQHSEVKTPLYDPCAPYSRLGVTRQQAPKELPEGISGLHFHTLCELGSDSLGRTLDAVQEQFGDWLKRIRWVNFGGGHALTKDGYDHALLVKLIVDFKKRYNVDVYLEPGTAVALNAGVLVSSVLDLLDNGLQIAMLDVSATAHMPDVLEMPYRPRIRGGGDPNQKKHTYRLGGMTCLAGDVVGDWSFDEALKVGSRLVFEDMAHYTMVKTTNFNGVRLPHIVLWDPRSNEVRVARSFGYEDYASRLS